MEVRKIVNIKEQIDEQDNAAGRMPDETRERGGEYRQTAEEKMGGRERSIAI